MGGRGLLVLLTKENLFGHTLILLQNNLVAVFKIKMSEFIFEQSKQTELHSVFSEDKTSLPSIASTTTTSGKHVFIKEDVGVSKKGFEDDDDYDDDSSADSMESNKSESSDDIYVDKTFFREWGCHYSLRQPWNDADQPAVKIFDYSKLSLNEVERRGVLSDRIVASCSSYLDKSPYINKFVMCKCALANKVKEI